MAINIHMPSSPRHLKITPTMTEDFLRDPVLACWWLFGIVFDAFQAAALRIEWFVPNVIDESGFGTGKSLRLWALGNLRCTLMENQWCYAYYPRFESGKEIFWPYYRSRFGCKLEFQAQLGNVDFQGEKDGKDNTKGPACYIQHFKNGSQMMMGAPGWLQNAPGQAGLTLSWALIDEWTKIEAMGKKTGASVTVAEGGGLAGGIDQQILGRLRRESFNQYHMLWGNHIIFSATAESMNHPSQRRVNNFKREIDSGNPNYAIVSYSFKDASNLPSDSGKPFRDQIIDWSAISRMKGMFTRSHFLRECLGIRSKETQGWYSEDALARCVAAGVQNGLEPQIGRNEFSIIGHAQQQQQQGQDLSTNPEYTFYFMGVDPAPSLGAKADDGALAILRARPRPGVRELSGNLSEWVCEYIWAYRLRKATARQWSGFIHRTHRNFGLAGICMDPQGGGSWINGELILENQIIDGVETKVMPIASMEDAQRTGPAVQLILSMYRRRDPGIQHIWPQLAGDDNLYEAMHNVFQEAVVYQNVTFPKPYNERPGSETEAWPEEKKWALKTLDTARGQMMEIQVETLENGTFATTARGAKKFSATGKKDLAYACIYAYVRFFIWLRMGELGFSNPAEDGGGYYAMEN